MAPETERPAARRTGNALFIAAVLVALIATPLLLRWAMKPRGPQYCADCSWPANRTHRRAEILPWHFSGGSSTPDPANIKTLANAQADFRANDRDGNGIQDFWQKDVAGLYLLPGRDGSPIKLIGAAAALADDRPAVDLSSLGQRAPCRGWWFRAIPHEADPRQSPDRFAFCEFPAEYPHHGKWTFIIDDNGILWRKDCGHGGGVDVFPKNPEQQGWGKVD